MNEELLQAMLRIKDGTATQADYQLYETSLNGGKALASSAYKNRQTPTTKYSDIVEKISRGEATPQEISEYQAWAESENNKRGYINFDPVFGGDVSGTTQNTDNTFSGGQALVPTPVRTPNSAVPSWVINPLGLPDKEAPYEPSWMTQKNPDAIDLTDKSKMSLRPPYNYDGGQGGEDPFKTQPFLPYLYPGGSDLSTELYSLGRAIGAPKGAQGRLATGIGAGGAAALDIARNVMSGIGYEKANSFAEDWYRKRLQDQEYESQSQTRDTNNVGRQFRDGGMFNGVGFEMGGEQEMPMEVAPQEQQADPMQQVVEIVTQLLQQGAPQEQIIQALVQQGIPQEQAVQIINQVMQQMQPQQTTKDGKTVNAQPGQQITFKHGGKKVSGTVKEIRDGKIILE